MGVQVNLTGVNSQSECFRITGGDRNRFEQLRMHDGMGIGWYLTSGASNLVLNCDAYDNRGLDSFSIGNIDGFWLSSQFNQRHGQCHSRLPRVVQQR